MINEPLGLSMASLPGSPSTPTAGEWTLLDEDRAELETILRGDAAAADALLGGLSFADLYAASDPPPAAVAVGHQPYPFDEPPRSESASSGGGGQRILAGTASHASSNGSSLSSIASIASSRGGGGGPAGDPAYAPIATPTTPTGAARAEADGAAAHRRQLDGRL